jgi:hypothetical protein
VAIDLKNNFFNFTYRKKMEVSDTYNIILPKGEAMRPFFELTESERIEIGREIFKEVTQLAAKVGSLPVISSNMPKKASKKISLSH